MTGLYQQVTGLPTQQVGHVGATVAHLIVSQGLADTLVLVDKNPDKLASEVLDFRDAASLLPQHVTVTAGTTADLGDADVVISKPIIITQSALNPTYFPNSFLQSATYDVPRET
ncbi:hypothetical protein GQS40_11915|uniref:Lactate/malate dehydrogenase N-terminal domain-containing protein n=1 Tax=Leuconostoc lactis TaxID=1246 RepID=A0A6L7AHG5_LEULA|nr:hypothetical protein [Leuconostoc lactis]